jgi:septal ring-binding cell division protein DamX
MAAGGKRGGGERILEGRHVIGLFLIIMLLSGVFFTLGYVMGRNQYDGEVRAATNPRAMPDPSVTSKTDVSPKHSKSVPAPNLPTDTAASPNSDWEFYHAGEAKKTEDRLKPAPSEPPARTLPAVAKSGTPGKPSSASSKTVSAPLIPGGSYTLQVAAMTKEADALDLAARLQKQKFPAFVVPAQGDKYYRVQVGPYPDQKSADIAKKGLDGAGFKAIVKH